MPTQPANRLNPFPGLRPFQIDEEYLFFGRETQRKELIALLREHRFVAVLGASGSGKSSLVRAGLLTALYGGVMTKAGSLWNTALLRPGGSPIRNLAAALLSTELSQDAARPTQLELETTLGRSGLGLIEAVRQARMPDNENLLIVVDQFEELFRFGHSQPERSTRDEAAAFVNLLLEAVRQEQVSVYVVLTMRSDFFGDCSQFEDLAEAINKGEYLVPRLTRDQKKQAIEGPVKVGGASISPRLVQRLLGDLGEDPDQLPIMQHALMRTWDHWCADHAPDEPLDLRHYEGIGGMGEALSRHADEVFAELPDDRHRLVAERIFKALTERGSDNRGIRRPTRVSLLTAITAASDAETGAVIEAFRKSGCTFLMPPEPAELAADTVIDISHESLMRVWHRLRRWVEDEAQSARIYIRLAETAALNAEEKADLYHDPDLQITLSWRASAQPNEAWARRYDPGFEVAIGFLDKSAAARLAEERVREAARQRELEQAKALAAAEHRRAEEQARFAGRLKWLVRGLGLVAILALAAFSAALVARWEARHQAQLAELSNATAQRNAERAKQQAHVAEEQRGAAEGARRESQQIADQLKSTLTRADFIAGSEQLEAGKVTRALSFLARSIRTDPAFNPAAFLTLQALSQNTLPLELPVTLKQDKPIRWWAMNETKDVIWTVDLEGRGFLWNVAVGEKIAPLAEGRQVDRVHFTRDGKLVFASARIDGEIRGWDAHSGKAATPAMKPGYGFGDYFVSAPTSQGFRLVVQNGDGSLQLWDTARGETLGPRLITAGKVVRFGFSPDGRWVYGDFDDRKLGLWDASNGQPLREPIEHNLVVDEARVSPDSRFLVLSSQAGKQLHWWEASAKTATARKAELQQPVRAFWFNRAGDQIVAAGWDNGREVAALQLKVFDVATGKETARIDETGFNPAPGLAWGHPDQRRGALDYWIVGGVIDQRRFKVWDLDTGKPIAELPLQESRITAAVFSPEGGRVAIALENREVRVWDLFSAKPLTTSVALKDYLQSLFFSEDGEQLLIAVQADGTWVHTYAARTGKAAAEPFRISAGQFQENAVTSDRSQFASYCPSWVNSGEQRSELAQGEVLLWRSQSGEAIASSAGVPGVLTYAEFSPDGKRMLGVTANVQPAYAFIWDVKSGKLLTKLRHPDGLLKGRFSPDGKRIVTAGLDHVARVWSLEEEKVVLKLVHDAEVFNAEFSPDGKSILTLTFGGKVQVWDAQTGHPLFPPVKVANFIYEAVFSPDGARFAVAGLEPRFREFETQTGKEAVPPTEIGKAAYHIAYSPDGKVLFGTSFQGIAAAWDAQTGNIIRNMSLALPYHAVAVHPLGDLIATSSGGNDMEDGAVQLWDWRTGRLAGEPMPIPARALYVTFSPDGSRVAAITATGAVKIWDVGTGRNLISRAARNTHFAANQTDSTALQFGSDGQRLLAAFGMPGAIEVLDLAGVEGKAPDWLPDLAEAVAGTRLNEKGGLESVPHEQLEALRRTLANSSAGDRLAGWARWFFADRQIRPIGVGAGLSVAEYALKLTSERGPVTNRFKALQLAPNDGRIYARLGFDLAGSTNRASIPAHATNHWNATIEWYVNQATNLAPESAEVWALRAGALVALGHTEQAAAAADRACALDSGDPNAWYCRALSLAAGGQPEEAYRAFTKAFDLLPRKTDDLEWQNQKLKPYLAGALQDWMEVEKQNPVELAHVGRRRLDDTSDGTERKYWEARWLTKRATELLPEDPEVWLCHAQVLLGSEQEEEAFADLKKAADLDEAGSPLPQPYGAWLRSRIELLDKAGRYEESRSFAVRRGIPPRQAGAKPIQIDLTRHYNASLWEDVHRSKGAAASRGAWWEDLPKGLTTLAGIEFDLRGEIQLNGLGLAQGNSSSSGTYAITYPQEIKGIRVGSKAQWLHLLHSAGWGGSVKSGSIIGRYRLHYVDGKTHEFPIVVGADLSEWRGNPFGRPTRATLAWIERSGESYKTMYVSSWENPRPDVEIAEMDLRSDMTMAGPMVFAITLENAKSDSELQDLPALTLAEEALAKVKRVQGLNQAGKNYADKLSMKALSKTPENRDARRLRAEVLVRSEKLAEARPLVDSLLATDEKDAAAWDLKALWLARSGSRDESLAATRTAIDLLSAAQDPTGERRKGYVQTAIDLLNAEGRTGEARRFVVRANLPPRNPSTTPRQVDLDAYYNAGLSEGWYQRGNSVEAGAVLHSFPRGLSTLQGIAFDARGIIQLNSRNRVFVNEFPNQVTGIKVGLRGDLVHFLHACSINERFGTVVARYRIHYANGQTNEFPLVFGKDLDDFYVSRAEIPEANLAWRGERVTPDKGDAGLFLSSWQNPTPEIEITAIDFVSELSESQPFLVAITVEPFQSDVELAKSPPLQLAELAFHKANPKLRPTQRTLTYAKQLSQKSVQLGGDDAEVWHFRAKFLLRLGEEKQSLEAIEKSLALRPESSEAWQLKTELLAKLKRFDDAQTAQSEGRRRELKEKIPPRDPNAGTNVLELSAFYDVALSEPIHAQAGYPAADAPNYSELPVGLQRFGGIEFDLRGIVHLQGASSERAALQRAYPRSASGIKVSRQAQKIHFLHGVGFVRSEPAETLLAKYIVHFANGEQREIPFSLVTDAYDWHLSGERRNQPTCPQSKLVWRGKGGTGEDRDLGLYLKTWDNPLPGVEIISLDFVSSMNEASPFLVAVTLE